MLEAGLVKSLARPEGNTTGTNLLSTQLDGKRQEILIEALPGIQRVAALADSTRDAALRLMPLQEAARAHNIELSAHQVGRPDEISAAIDAAEVSGATALNVLASPFLYANRQAIMMRVAALRLPAIYEFPEQAKEGGIGYGPRVNDFFEDIVAGQLVALLRGVKPADIPVGQPTKLDLVINLQAANKMGVTVPESLLARADKVIE